MNWHTPSQTWRSGHWSLSLRDDEFADISYDDHVVLRSVRAVVRDRNWDTAGLIIERTETSDRALELSVRSEDLGSSFAGTVRVSVTDDGIDVSCDLESADAFETNRTGLVVLHPPTLAGSPLQVTHSSGDVVASAFPVDIAPHQPELDITALAWDDAGLHVDVRFTGDVFEMEDQRNWTDASFKTYSRPLALPFPYRIAERERVRQTVSVQVTGTLRPAPAASDLITLRGVGPFPTIGVQASNAPDPAPTAPPIGDVVLVELDLVSPNWRAALDRAQTAGRPLDVRFIADADAPEPLRDGVAALVGLDVRRVAAYHLIGDARHVSDTALVEALRDALAATGLEIPVVGGVRSHFTELNRERHRLPAQLDGLTVTVTPLFHARGTEQLIESIAMQRLVAQQTVAFAAGVPVHIGPVHLRPRFNDVATAPQPRPVRADLVDGYGAEFTGSVDSRQSSPELAAWIVASAAAMTVPGIASLTWFEEWGPRGIRSSDGRPHPAASAIAALLALDGELLSGDSPDGLLWALGAHDSTADTDADTDTVLVANLDTRERTVQIDSPAGLLTTTSAPSSFRRHRIIRNEEAS